MRPVFRQGLLAPAAVAAAALVAGVLGGAAAALVVVSVGAALIVGFHLRELQAFTDWAAGSLDAPVPEGRGVWQPAMSAMYKRVRTRITYQRELREMILRFQQAAEAIPEGIVVLDRSQRIEWANARAVTQLGLDLDHDLGQPIANLVRQPEFLRYLEAGDYGDAIVVPSGRDHGMVLALRLVPFALDKKLLMARDVTQLEALARMRRDFIANVSHELKTPLTVIAGFIETMQDMELDERQRARFLGLMHEQARNMQRLVVDLITLSALESEHNPLAEERFAIVPLMLELSADAKALSRGAHEVVLDIGEAAIVTGSRDELASAFANLVSNAVRYTPSRGRIAIAWRVDPDGTGVFEVADSGIGIAEEHLPRLTERFYRVDRSRSRATGGTGLGLAIVKHVLLRHQADLAVASELGRGSTFSVRLPAARIERAPAAGEGEGEPAARPGSSNDEGRGDAPAARQDQATPLPPNHQ